MKFVDSYLGQLGIGFPRSDRRASIPSRSSSSGGKTESYDLGRGAAAPASCPRGWKLYTKRGGIPGGSGDSRFPLWSCMRQQTISRNAPVAPRITVSPTFTVSPAIQTQISPQVSPVFQQAQDSPGSSQSGAPTKVDTGSQRADTGGRNVELERMKMEHAMRMREMEIQAERDRQRRNLETFLHRPVVDTQSAQETIDIPDTPAPQPRDIGNQSDHSDLDMTAFMGPPPSSSGTTNELTIPIGYEPDKPKFPLPILAALGAGAIGIYYLSTKKKARK